MIYIYRRLTTIVVWEWWWWLYRNVILERLVFLRFVENIVEWITTVHLFSYCSLHASLNPLPGITMQHNDQRMFMLLQGRVRWGRWNGGVVGLEKMVFATWRNNRNDTVNVFGSVYGLIINGETICRVGRNANKSLYQTCVNCAACIYIAIQ